MLQRVTSMLLVLQCSCHHCIVRCTLTLHTVIDLLTYLLIYLFIYPLFFASNSCGKLKFFLYCQPILLRHLPHNFIRGDVLMENFHSKRLHPPTDF